MKVAYPKDLEGRLIRCNHRARLIAEALEAFTIEGRALDAKHASVSPQALSALGDIADELGDEIAAIDQAYCNEHNESYAPAVERT
jgi:hypothetical protein